MTVARLSLAVIMLAGCMPPELTHGVRIDPGVDVGMTAAPGVAAAKNGAPQGSGGGVGDLGVFSAVSWRQQSDLVALRATGELSSAALGAIDLYSEFPRALPDSFDLGLGWMVQAQGAHLPYVLAGRALPNGVVLYAGEGLWLSGGVVDSARHRYSATLIGLQPAANQQRPLRNFALLVIAGPRGQCSVNLATPSCRGSTVRVALEMSLGLPMPVR